MGLFSIFKKKKPETMEVIESSIEPEPSSEQIVEQQDPVVENSTVHSDPEPKIIKEEKPIEEFLYYGFKVHGISFREKSIIKELADVNDDYSMTKRDLVDCGMTGERIYKYDIYVKDIEFVPEPDNPHDENAVKILADGVHIGYVPVSKTKKLLRLLEKEEIITIACDFQGGPYKVIYEEYTYDGKEKYEMSTGATSIGALIAIKYKNPKFK